MAPSPSAEGELAPAEAAALLDLADASIVEGLNGRGHLVPDAESFSGRLAETAGSFVTIRWGVAWGSCTSIPCS